MGYISWAACASRGVCAACIKDTFGGVPFDGPDLSLFVPRLRPSVHRKWIERCKTNRARWRTMLGHLRVRRGDRCLRPRFSFPHNHVPLQAPVALWSEPTLAQSHYFRCKAGVGAISLSEFQSVTRLCSKLFSGSVRRVVVRLRCGPAFMLYAIRT
jgi:hypothetical protein